MDNRNKGTDNRNKGTDNRNKGMDIRTRVRIIETRVRIIGIRVPSRTCRSAEGSAGRGEPIQSRRKCGLRLGAAACGKGSPL